MRGKLFGVGVGPGDPELLTIKAVRILRAADVIAVPDQGAGERTALRIAKEYVEGKPLLPCVTPMVRDRAALNDAHDAIAGTICAQLDRGKTVAYITLGDPTIYSTYLYIHRRVLRRGYDAEIVPGVPSFCAAAARLNAPLCEGTERLLIVPASQERLEEDLDIPANKVFMKAGRSIGALREALRRRGDLDHAAIVENCGMENERVFPQFSSAADGAGYYSVVLVKNGAAHLAGYP